MQFEIEGVGVPITGHEEDYLDLFPENGDLDHLGMASLLERAGAVAVNWGDQAACEHQWPEEWLAYRQRTGREYPRLYRVRLTATVEPLTEEESAARWASRHARHKPRGEA